VLLFHARNSTPAIAEPICYRTILVPLDGSLFAEQALLVALPIARAKGTTLVLVAVMKGAPGALVDTTETSALEAGLEPLWFLAERDAEAQHIKRYLQRIAQQASAQGVEVRTEIAYGDPSKAILATGVEQRADLIVAASHGRTGLQRVMLGSVARELIRRTDRPLLLVRPTGALFPFASRVDHGGAQPSVIGVEDGQNNG